MSKYSTMALMMLGVLVFAGAAWAHSIYVFAYPEGAQICTSSYFGGKAKVKGGQVLMKTASGEILGRGQTDDEGLACFPAPEKAEVLVFSVEASGGHRGEFTLPPADYSALEPEAVIVVSSPGGEGPAAGAAGALTQADLNIALAPVMQKLAEMESAAESRVSLRDVVGGLGWIIGLFGVYFWAVGRRKG